MITKTKKGFYQSPRVRITWMEPEGLICESIKIQTNVKDWENMNATEGSDLWGSPVIES